MLHLHERLARHAIEQPHAPALIQADQVISYRVLEQAVASITQWLIAQGIEPGMTVGLQLRNTRRSLLVSLALLRIGAVQSILPIKMPQLQYESLCRQLQVIRIITDAEISGPPGVILQFPRPSELKAAYSNVARSGGALKDSDLALLCHGSGTTGKPKIIPLTYDIITYRMNNIPNNYRIKIGERAVSLHSPSSLSYWTRAMMTLYFGGGWILGPFVKPDQNYARAVFNIIDQLGVNYMDCTAFHARRLVDEIKEEGALRLPHVKAMTVGGAEVTPRLRQDILKKITTRMVINYVTNETGPIARASPDLLRHAPDTVGHVLPLTKVQLRDDQGNNVSANESGIIWVQSPTAAVHYYGDGEATRRAFKGGWFRTNDIGRLSADGSLHVIGRSDDMMMMDGINIHPSEIEHVLSAHPSVSEVAAVGLSSEAHNDIPVAFVVKKSKSDEAELLAYCDERLGVRAPRRIFFCKELPRNAAGKVVRRELKLRLAAEEN